MRTFVHVLSIIIVAILGWIGGSLYPAPSTLIGEVSPQSLVARLRGDLESLQRTRGMNWASIQSLLGPSEAKRLADDALRAAQQAGGAIEVEHVVDEATKEAEEQFTVPTISVPTPNQIAPVAPSVQPVPAQTASLAPQSAPAKPASGLAAPTAPATAAAHPAPPASNVSVSTAAGVAPSLRGGFEAIILECPGMTVSDAPPADADRRLADFSPMRSINGDVIAVDPIRDACLASGFGTRNGRLHKGIDFYNAAGGPILAAGDGTIIEMKYRDDYGNMILIDHGHGVYTRYAHLSSFHNGLAVGAHVHAGDEIGLMGNTAGYPVPLHLHFELLLGDYGNPKASFGLTPHSPFEYRAAT